MWEEEKRKKMKEGEGMMMDTKCPGRMAVNGKKTFLGKPPAKTSQTPKMNCLDKANMRGKDNACMKMG